MANDRKKYFIFCFILFIFAILSNRFIQILDERLIIFFPAFAVGILLASNKGLIGNQSLSVIALFLTVSIMISFIDYRPIFIWPPLALFGPLFVFLIVLREERRIGCFSVIAHIGYAGFFMYLLHRPVFEVSRKLYFPESGILQIFYLSLICLPIIIFISWSLQKDYDNFIMLLTPGVKSLLKRFYQ